MLATFVGARAVARRSVASVAGLVPEPALLIDNQLVRCDQTLPVLAPHTGRQFASIPNASAIHVDQAVQAARRCFESDWSAPASAPERAGQLQRLAGLLETRSDDLSRLESMDCGKPVGETVSPEAGHVVAFRGGLRHGGAPWSLPRAPEANSLGSSANCSARQAGGARVTAASSAASDKIIAGSRLAQSSSRRDLGDAARLRADRARELRTALLTMPKRVADSSDDDSDDGEDVPLAARMSGGARRSASGRARSSSTATIQRRFFVSLW